MSGGLVLAGNSWAQTPDDPALDITGDIDIRVAVAMTDWTPSGSVGFVFKWETGQQSYGFQIRSDGKLYDVWDDDGSGGSIADGSSVAPTVADGAILAIRFTLLANSLGVRRSTFFTKASTPANALADCADDASWVTLGTQTVSSSTSIFAGTSPLRVGTLEGLTQFLVGTVYAVVIKNGIAGTTVANPDFYTNTLPFTDGAGRSWSYATGDITVGMATESDTALPLAHVGSEPPPPGGVAGGDFPEMFISVGFSAGASTGTALIFDDSTRGKWDTGTWGQDAVYFSEIGRYVQRFSTRRSSSRVVGPVLRFEAGTSSAVLNDADRRFDPTNLDGPYVSAGESQVKPMRIVRYQATWAGITYDLWHGYADDWPVSFAKSLRYSEAILTATDLMKPLEANDRVAVSPVGAGEDSGARIGRILDSSGVSPVDRIIATGDTTVQATTLGGTALAEIQLTSDTEIGQFYVDGSGRAVFRNRQAAMTEARSRVSQATFGTAAGEFPFYDVTVATDIVQMVNKASITRVGGSVQTSEDSASQAEYLLHGYTNGSLIMQDDATALNYASFLVYQCKDPELRFEQLVIKPMRDPTNLFPQVLGRQIGDRITIILRPENGPAIERDCFIVGIGHDVDVGTRDWTATFSLQSATKWSFFTWDDPILGVWDSNAWAY